MTARNGSTRVRYAVVGLGYISQAAVLPAFAHARRNSELVALVSDDPKKLKRLSRRYEVPRTYTYDEYDDCLRSGEVDAVYIGLPNDLHREYTVRAARAGVHVLCEKPMAIDEEECEEMIRAARESGVRLMIAYRLHFERANLEAVEIVNSGKIGGSRVFDSVFSYQVQRENIRTERERGGGPLYDIGIYCINAARYLFRAEPREVVAYEASADDPRFAEVPEMVTACIRFPEERLATFTCSFGAADVARYSVLGTKGELVVEHAYEYAEPIEHRLTVQGKTKTKKFGKRDQFGPELVYFSKCVLEGRDPEPSGEEGLADVRVIRAILRSIETREAVALGGFDREVRPTRRQRIDLPPVKKPKLVNAKSPTRSA